MFDIGWGKILIVGVVALIVIGPHELPGLLKSLGSTIAKLKRMAADFQYQFNQALNESGVNDIKNTMGEATSFDPVSIARDSLKNAIEEVKPSQFTESQGPELPSDFHVEPVLAELPPIHFEEPQVEEKPARKPRKKKEASDE